MINFVIIFLHPDPHSAKSLDPDSFYADTFTVQMKVRSARPSAYHRVRSKQGVAKRCCLSLLTNSALVYRTSPIAAGFHTPEGPQRDVVYLGWPMAPSCMSPNAGGWGGGGVAGSEPMSTAVYITWRRVRINFGDLPPYLAYGSKNRTCAVPISWTAELPVCGVQGPAAKAEEEGRIVIAANNPISCLHEYAKKVGFRF